MERMEHHLHEQDKKICVECGTEIVDPYETAALYECERCLGTNEDEYSR